MSDLWNERTKQDRKEIPVGVQYNPTQHHRVNSLSDDTTLWDAHRPPSTDHEAMMQDGEPAVSQETLQARWEHVQTLIEQAALTPKELAVIEYVVFGEKSLADAGRWLGLQFRDNGTPYSKMMVSKLRDSALKKLRVTFTEGEKW